MKINFLIGLFMLAIFCIVNVSAQESSGGGEPGKNVAKLFEFIKRKGKPILEESQVKAFCQPDFVGEEINLNVVEADLGDILNYITEQHGFDFVIDKAVKSQPITVKVTGMPWNKALNTILELQGLMIQCHSSVLRIAERSVLEREGLCRLREHEPDNSPLYTEFIKLKRPSQCSNDWSCEQKTSFALKQLKQIVEHRLSKRGAVEADEYSQTLIITDVRENLEFLKHLVALLNTEDFYNKIEEDKESF
ncbi:MAG TPA: hypothetical protein VF721_16365 [Pyrinomonadaceae bacterium]|jgi:type IV pilus assembly protein PilQ